jgi:hypothetical protein
MPPEGMGRARHVTLGLAAASAAAFILVQSSYDLEESAFLGTLGAFAGGAAVMAVLSSLALRRGVHRTAAHGFAAAALVPALFVAYIVVRLLLCLFGFGECYGN